MSSKLNSIIIALCFSTVDQMGEANVNVAYQLVNSCIWFTEGSKISSAQFEMLLMPNHCMTKYTFVGQDITTLDRHNLILVFHIHTSTVLIF